MIEQLIFYIVEKINFIVLTAVKHIREDSKQKFKVFAPLLLLLLQWTGGQNVE
jgi:hypothetical protein